MHVNDRLKHLILDSYAHLAAPSSYCVFVVLLKIWLLGVTLILPSHSSQRGSVYLRCCWEMLAEKTNEAASRASPMDPPKRINSTHLCLNGQQDAKKPGWTIQTNKCPRAIHLSPTIGLSLRRSGHTSRICASKPDTYRLTCHSHPYYPSVPTKSPPATTCHSHPSYPYVPTKSPPATTQRPRR
jgi:hypothetical protein